MKVNKKGSNKSKAKNSTFFPATVQPKLSVNTPGDTHEREADRIADQVISQPKRGANPLSRPSFFTPAATKVQREEKDDKSGDVLSEGASVAYEQLKLNPGYEAWEKKQTDALKLKLWDSQSTGYKAGIVSFGLVNLGLLGTAFAMDPRFRSDSIDFLQDKNILLPLGLLPYSEYFPVSSFKYKLPAAQFAPYTFSTEFGFDPWLKLMQEKWGGPKIGLSVGVDSAYSNEKGFDPVKGGKIKVKIGGGIINFSGFYNQTLPATPMLISNPGPGQPPVWIMRSLPDQLSENLPKGHGVFLTVDIARLPDLWAPKKKSPTTSLQFRKSVSVQRKENGPGKPSTGVSATNDVHRVLSGYQGKPLDKRTRNFMEKRFDQDFSHVRIHTGTKAAESAESINAKAYTSGNQIVFGNGHYQPSSTSGRRLIAHELVHVGQQSGLVQRKESNKSTSLAENLKKKLLEGKYNSARLALHDYFGSGDEDEKKRWLTANNDVRYLFLRNLPATVLVEVYSAQELIQLNHYKAYKMIDCWYQTQEDKQLLYSNNLKLFDHFLRFISPYSGRAIQYVVRSLTAMVKAHGKYTNDQNKHYRNRVFHEIHLLAPTVKRKIEFYNKYQDFGLFKQVKKKFDPFTGLTHETFETLTDTNEVDHKKAKEIYEILKKIPPEQRRAFLDTALFAGSLESDKDAQKYYRKKFKKQYKALPHNWDFAFWPWNWGEAPFADRMTIDHAALMSGMLNYEDKATREFGFDKGIDSSLDPHSGKLVKDSDRLINQMKEEANFTNPRRMALLLAIAIRGEMATRVTQEVLLPRHKEGAIPRDTIRLLTDYGFIPAQDYTYQADKAIVPVYDKSAIWYLLKQTLFSSTGSLFGERRATVDLPTLQNMEMFRGAIGGLKFDAAKHKWDEYFNTKWLDKKLKENPGASTLIANVNATAASDRKGKVFASLLQEKRQLNVFAPSLSIAGLNYFSDGTLYRSGKGIIQGLHLKMTWDKDPGDANNEVKLVLNMSNFGISQLQLIAQKSTLAIGKIGLRSFRFRLTRRNFPGLSGLFKAERLSAFVLMDLLPNVMKLIPYSIMAMTEEFKGVKTHAYKDALAEVAKKDFSFTDFLHHLYQALCPGYV